MIVVDVLVDYRNSIHDNNMDLKNMMTSNYPERVKNEKSPTQFQGLMIKVHSLNPLKVLLRPKPRVFC